MRPLAAVLNGVCAVAGVLVVAVIAVFMLIDPNDYKARVVDAVQDATGRTLTLGGELSLTRSLWPTLVATDVDLSNLPGGSRPQMVHVERIEAQLSLPALLRHEVDITRLALRGPNILFEQVDGAPNWVFAPAAPAPQAAADAGAGYALRVERAIVGNGMVTWKLPARTKVVGIRTLDFQRRRADGPLSATSTLVYSDNAPFQLDLQADPTGGVMDPWRTRLHFAAFDTVADATGSMTVAGPFDLQVEAKAGAAEKLNALLPSMNLPALHGVALSAHLANGPRPGDIPAIGPATLRFASGDLRALVSRLVLGAGTVTLPSAGGQAAVDGVGQYAGSPFHLFGSVGVPVHPDGKASVPVTATVTVAGATVGLKGTATADTLQFTGLNGAVTVEAKALASLRPVLGGGVPALEDVRFAGQVSVPAATGAVRLEGVSLQTRQGDVAGEGSVTFGAVPGLSGSWRSGSLDMDGVLAAAGVDLTGSVTPQDRNGPMIPDLALPWGALLAATLDVDLAVGSMQFQGQVWRDVRAAVGLKGGSLRAGPVSVQMPGSRMQAALGVDAATAGVPVRFSLLAPALPLQLIARYFGIPGPVTGTADVSAEWQARGRTMRQLAASLDGPFSVTSTGGTLTNAAMIGLTKAALDALSIHVPAQGETRLDCLGLVGSFAAGVGTFRTIALQTTSLSLAGAGQVDLGRETVALKLEPMAEVAGSRVRVPVVVRGPFRNVGGTLDAGGLEQLGFLIDGLFGGDTSRVCAAAGLGR